MVFYAYISDAIRDDLGRIVMAFANSSTADEWWRAISDSNNRLFADVQRITPEMYTHNVGVFNMLNFFANSGLFNISQQFRGRLILSSQNDYDRRGIDIFPKQTFTNLIGGNWFYIRSISDPEVYWHYENNLGCGITISRTNRSLFRLKGQNLPTGKVIIRSDAVQLSMWPDGDVVMWSDGRLWTRGSSLLSFKFGDLASGRFISTGGGLAWDTKHDGFKRPGWELVE
ncbi:hypothetical protein L218DRAFT_987289 [Marasmius fiardii PR-910]|nr:hypothetical protein L218DRAFT_987289 [Marasmius fiardii PR-910]